MLKDVPSGSGLTVNGKYMQESNQGILLNKRKQFIAGKTLSRRTNFFIRMPNWLGDVVMAIPVLLAIRKGRPDVRFTLVAKTQFIPLLRKFELGEDYLPLPQEGTSYFGDFRKLLKYNPENYLLFTNSLRGDLEAFLSGCAQRFGLKLGGRSRPLLTNYFDPFAKTVIKEKRHIRLNYGSRWRGILVSGGSF